MKQPKLSELKIDRQGTARVRSAMARATKIKITINVDAESVQHLRRMAEESGVPYQRLLNQVLREGLTKRATTETRLARLEDEVKKLKQRIAA